VPGIDDKLYRGIKLNYTFVALYVINLVAVASIGNRSNVGIISTRKLAVAAGIFIVDVVVDMVLKAALV